MNPRAGLFFLVPVALFVLAVTIFAASAKHAVNPLVKFAPCYSTPSLGPNVKTCAKNLHAYHVQNGRPVDMGRLTPVPKLPVN